MHETRNVHRDEQETEQNATSLPIHASWERELLDSGSLDSTISPSIKDAAGKDIVHMPGRVLFALSQVPRNSRRAAKRAALAFARGELEGTRLPGTEQAFVTATDASLSVEPDKDALDRPLYAVAATPRLFILVRHGREPNAPVIVEDLVTRALWEQLAYAGQTVAYESHVPLELGQGDSLYIT